MRVNVPAVAVALAVCACGPQVAPVLSLSFSVSPTSIDDRGQRALLRLSVYDENGVPADGTVTLSAEAGLLAGGADAGRVVTVQLDDAGMAPQVGFTCRRALDPGCQGSVKLDAVWTKGDAWLEQVKRVTVTTDGGL